MEILKAAVAFGVETLSLNDPAAPLNIPPVSDDRIVREMVKVVAVPVVTTFEIVTAPPDKPVIVSPWFACQIVVPMLGVNVGTGVDAKNAAHPDMGNELAVPPLTAY